ncbi:hypothetical protein, conserved [Leishmania tarentolae]|uniref:Uncharacterized protein n=1 Tax=Leishmania tarentolae TaxID=5689 RepID=A0A640KQ32_LEITA|nr:hypothetical protein, conserved [Leishmania tarentolae]
MHHCARPACLLPKHHASFWEAEDVRRCTAQRSKRRQTQSGEQVSRTPPSSVASETGTCAAHPS